MPPDSTDDQDKTAVSLPPREQSGHVLSEQTLVDGIYQVQKEIGAGGAGSVYQVQQIALKKNFALKVLHDTYSDIAMRRFHKEAQIAAGLDHPNLVRAVHSGSLPDGKPFYVMDLVSGMTLSERLEEGPLRPSDVIDVFLPLCLALDYAHAQGLVHRDLKPGNTVLTIENGHVVPKIIDFGIAHLALSETTTSALTRTGEIFGTPKYMSPEQSLSKKVDQRSDIYSLGCMMFECLTGKVPFAGENAMSTIALHVTSQPPTLQEAAPDLRFARGWQEIIDKMLAKDPEHRFMSCAKVAHALEAVRDNTVALPAKNKAEASVRPGRSRIPMLAVVGAGLGLITASGALFFLYNKAATNGDASAGRPSATDLARTKIKYPGIEKTFEKALAAVCKGDWTNGANASQTSLNALKMHNLAKVNREDLAPLSIRCAIFALCLFNAGNEGEERLPNSLVFVNEAITDNPYAGEYYTLRGNIYKAMGKDSDAAADFAKSKIIAAGKPSECDTIMRDAIYKAARADIGASEADPDATEYDAGKKLILNGNWREGRTAFGDLIESNVAYARKHEMAVDTRRASLFNAMVAYCLCRLSDTVDKKDEILERALTGCNRAINFNALPSEYYRIKAIILDRHNKHGMAEKNRQTMAAMRAQNADSKVDDELRSILDVTESSVTK